MTTRPTKVRSRRNSIRRPAGLMRGYQHRWHDRPAWPSTDCQNRRRRLARRRRLSHLRGTLRRHFQSLRLPYQPVRTGKRVSGEHPGAVAEAAVVPAPDPMRLAIPKAYVTLVSGAVPETPDGFVDLPALAGTIWVPFKRVRRLEFAELPKNHFQHKDPSCRIAAGRERPCLRRHTRSRRIPRKEDFPELRQV